MRDIRNRTGNHSLEFADTREGSFGKNLEFVPVGREFPDVSPEFPELSESAADAAKEFQEGKAKEAVSSKSENKNNLLRRMGYLITATVGVVILANSSMTTTYSGTCGPDATWYWEDGVLEIKGTGEITENPWKSDEYYEGGDEDVFQYSTNRVFDINKVIIDEGITSIYDNVYDGWDGGAFFGELDLIEVILPSTLEKIGDGTFIHCLSLSSITIPEGVTSIGDEAFWECRSLTSITIPESVTSIGNRAFLGYESDTIYVDENNPVYDSRNNCNAIIETATNTLIRGCNSTIIPDSVTSIGDDAFIVCRSLSSITIPDSVTSIGDCAFGDCTSLSSITIPDSVTSIGSNAFSQCESLTSIMIPDSVISIGEYAFNNLNTT